MFQPTNQRVGLEFYTSNIFKLVFCLATGVFLLRIVDTTVKVCMGTWWGDLATRLKATCSVGWWFFVALWLVKFPPPPGCTCNVINSLRWWQYTVAVDVVNISFVTAYIVNANTPTVQKSCKVNEIILSTIKEELTLRCSFTHRKPWTRAFLC